MSFQISLRQNLSRSSAVMTWRLTRKRRFFMLVLNGSTISKGFLNHSIMFLNISGEEFIWMAIFLYTRITELRYLLAYKIVLKIMLQFKTLLQITTSNSLLHPRCCRADTSCVRESRVSKLGWGSKIVSSFARQEIQCLLWENPCKEVSWNGPSYCQCWGWGWQGKIKKNGHGHGSLEWRVCKTYSVSI